MNGLKKLLITSFLFISQLSYGGGWTSGGGELIRDTHNPWFLSNTKQVSYCIKINEKDFGQSKEFVRNDIAKALNFWKAQLSELQYLQYGDINFDFKLATQTFTEVECGENVDLTFQFAFLEKDQKQRMGDLSKTIAVSVRTGYDSVNLKGKGFIYFNQNSQFPILPWTRAEGARLLPVMIHELGHVFGIQHDEDVWLMQEDYPEHLMSVENADQGDIESAYLRDHAEAVHLFTYNPSDLDLYLCASGETKPKPSPAANRARNASPVYDRFFGAQTKDNCSSLYVHNTTLIFSSGQDVVKKVGEANLIQKDLNSASGFMSAKRLIYLWLPPEQKVFAANANYASEKINVAQYQPKQFFKGTYKTLDGKVTRQVALEVNNGGNIVKVSGVLDGVLYSDLREEF